MSETNRMDNLAIHYGPMPSVVGFMTECHHNFFSSFLQKGVAFWLGRGNLPCSSLTV